MPAKSLILKLFDPGMTHLHRVGLAGLYMTLKSLNPTEYAEAGGWDLRPQSMELYWNHTPRDLLAPIIEKSFGISPEGIIQFYAHKSSSMGDLNRLLLHRAILLTYLQHGKTRESAGKERELAFQFEDKPIVESFKPLANFHKKKPNQQMFNSNGYFKKDIEMAGWLFPGGVVRHVVHSNATALTSDPKKFLALLYAPIGSLYFLISHKGSDGKYDKRKAAAIVFPHLDNLAQYSTNYSRYLVSPVQRLFVDGLGDAGLMALTMMNLAKPDSMIDSLEINSCTVFTLGTVTWNQKQKTRTGMKQVRSLNPPRLKFFDLAWRTLKNRPYITEDGKLIVGTSPVRGLLADNIAAGLPWYQGFYQLMISQQSARQISFEREGVHTMVEQAEWSEEADQLLVKAVHQALRNRYGALAQRAKERGETPAFDREFERIRTSLMRSKNIQTLRGELADIFARGGLNQTLQEHWPALIPLFTGADWQRARDLALLALASYAGKGAETIVTKEKED
jgi:CRISPR-associated protein Cas8a1/Csx13